LTVRSIEPLEPRGIRRAAVIRSRFLWHSDGQGPFAMQETGTPGQRCHAPEMSGNCRISLRPLSQIKEAQRVRAYPSMYSWPLRLSVRACSKEAI
jgi:hypothetical protein